MFRTNDCIDLVHDVDDSRSAVGRTILDDGIIPLRVFKKGLRGGAAANTAREDGIVRLHRECRVCTGEGAAIHDPWDVRPA